MARISYSQLSMFNECPQRWKLNYVDKLSISESNIYLVFGTAMHEVIQTYLDIMYNNSVKNAEKLDLNKMLFDNMCSEFIKAKEQDGKAPCTKEELSEFLQDGVDILDFIKTRRNQYFQKRDYELIGCEVPIELKLKKNIGFIGYLDLVILHKPTNTLKIIDIKTSTRGWNKYQKADKNKTQQLLLYKQFYSEQYNHPVDKIEVEYFIVKRKLWENTDFPQKRVQKFVPASGKPSMNKVLKGLDLFLEVAFDDDGKYNTDKIFALPSKKACKWCEFRKTEYCIEGV
tara:strand:- start:1268 stop:2125 length:858 start_codon:yes stop_codon:yes gene_type:complete